MKIVKHTRERDPLYPVFEFELKNELENMLINNYHAKKITTRFDFKLIKRYIH